MASTGWQVVHRRKSFPNNWRTPIDVLPLQTRPYDPYSKTYAQTVTQPPPPKAAQLAPQLNQKPNSHNSPPPTTATQTRTNTFNRTTPPPKPKAVYTSPHSPTALRFPPSHLYEEWRGRCFRCCMTGHTAAICRNPVKCGRCWRNGHPGNRCIRPGPVPGSPPSQPPVTKTTAAAAKPLEPSFDEMLTGPYPYIPPPVPTSRPDTVFCFIDRDETYFKEVAKLQQAVLIRTPPREVDPTTDKIAELVAKTEGIEAHEISVSRVSNNTYTMLLPLGISADTFIRATPPSLWDLGLTFHPWSKHLTSTLKVPTFKVILDLVDVPSDLYRERDIIRAVSSFGLYLGSIAQEDPSNLTRWTVAIATDDLERVPNSITMVVGGFQDKVRVHFVNWKEKPIYQQGDLPPQPKQYTHPSPPTPASTPPSSSSSEDSPVFEDAITIPRSIILQMCQNQDLQSLSAELRDYLNGIGEALQPPSMAATSPTENPHTQPLTHSLGSKSTDNQGNTPSKQITILQRPRSPVADKNNTIPTPTTQTTTTELPLQIQPQVQTPTPHHSPGRIIPLESSHAAKNSLTPTIREDQHGTPCQAARSALGTGSRTRGKQRALQDTPASEDALTLTQLRSTCRSKRKPIRAKDAGPSKKASSKQGDLAEIGLTEEGFYEVKVAYNHCCNIAGKCGFQPEVVQTIIDEDNLERRETASVVKETQLDSSNSEEEEGTGALFDLDSGDELDGDEEEL